MIERPPLASIANILVRGVNWIGDTILTLPALEALRRLFPQGHIALLARDHLCSLFAHTSLVDEVLVYPQGRGGALLRQEAGLVAALRRKHYELALILPRSPRAALIPWLAGIPYRVGYAASRRGMLLTHPVRETEELLHSHQVEYYYHLLQYLGVSDPWHMPCLPIGQEEEAWTEEFLLAGGVEAGQTLIALNPGSTYGPAKCWAPGRYIQLARRLLGAPHTRVLIVGGRDNASLVNFISLSLSGRVLTVVGENLLRVAALLRGCDLLVTNDTGPMHLAAALGTTVVALFGPTDRLTTAPLGVQHRIINKQIPCSPCLKRRCPTDHRCMESITVDDVERAVEECLKHPANKRSARCRRAAV